MFTQSALFYKELQVNQHEKHACINDLKDWDMKNMSFQNVTFVKCASLCVCGSIMLSILPNDSFYQLLCLRQPAFVLQSKSQPASLFLLLEHENSL